MGDWFLLYMLGQNINSVVFKELCHEFAKKLGYHNKDYESQFLAEKQSYEKMNTQ